jgi:hypothetical protein
VEAHTILNRERQSGHEDGKQVRYLALHRERFAIRQQHLGSLGPRLTGANDDPVDAIDACRLRTEHAVWIAMTAVQKEITFVVGERRGGSRWVIRTSVDVLRSLASAITVAVTTAATATSSARGLRILLDRFDRAIDSRFRHGLGYCSP